MSASTPRVNVADSIKFTMIQFFRVILPLLYPLASSMSTLLYNRKLLDRHHTISLALLPIFDTVGLPSPELGLTYGLMILLHTLTIDLTRCTYHTAHSLFLSDA